MRLRRKRSGYRFRGDRSRLSKAEARMVKVLETRGLKGFWIWPSAEMPRNGRRWR